MCFSIVFLPILSREEMRAGRNYTAESAEFYKREIDLVLDPSVLYPYWIDNVTSCID
jgi:hypothetical protein